LETGGRKAMGLRLTMIARLPEGDMSYETKHLMKCVIAVALVGILVVLLTSFYGGEIALSSI